MYTCEVVLKTAQETGESQGISKNHWEIVGIRGKLGNCVSLMGKQSSLARKSIPPSSGERGEMKENCSTKIPIWGICVKQVGKMRGK